MKVLNYIIYGSINKWNIIDNCKVIITRIKGEYEIIFKFNHFEKVLWFKDNDPLIISVSFKWFIMTQMSQIYTEHTGRQQFTPWLIDE
jgi:hypothetical protein